MQEVDVRTVNIEDLTDLRDIQIDTKLPVEEKLRLFAEQTNNLYVHRIGDYVVKVKPNDIIGGGVWYIDNTPKVTNESAIDKFLTATSEFFKAVIFPKWQRCPLSTVDNFKIYYQDILTRCNKKLKKHTSRIHLDDESVNNLLECLYELDDITPKNIMLKAVIPLILLYGFKIGTIAEIKRKDFDVVKRVINIQLEDNIINLELPYNVFVYVDKIYNRKVDDVYLFDTAKNQRLISDYFDDFLIKYNKRINVEAKITLDGLAKYAVINMFRWNESNRNRTNIRNERYKSKLLSATSLGKE